MSVWYETSYDVPAVTATGWANLTSCHPLGVSLANVALASDGLVYQATLSVPSR